MRFEALVDVAADPVETELTGWVAPSQLTESAYERREIGSIGADAQSTQVTSLSMLYGLSRPPCVRPNSSPITNIGVPADSSSIVK